MVEFCRMKKIILAIISAVVLYSCSSAGKPPAAIQKAFENKFQNASKVSWHEEGTKEWKAEFTFDNEKICANFANDGTWLETAKEIESANLPKAVAEVIKLKYSDWSISKVEETENSKYGIIYRASLKKGTDKKDVSFKEDGTSVGR